MNKNNELYLDDYSTEDIIDLIKLSTNNIKDDEENDNDNDNDISSNSNENKPSFTMKPNYNSKGEKVVIFSINIPLKKNGLKIV